MLFLGIRRRKASLGNIVNDENAAITCLCLVYHKVTFREAKSRLFKEISGNLVKEQKLWRINLIGRISCVFLHLNVRKLSVSLYSETNTIVALRVKVNVVSCSFLVQLCFLETPRFFRVTYGFKVTFVTRKRGDFLAHLRTPDAHRGYAVSSSSRQSGQSSSEEESLCSLHSEEERGALIIRLAYSHFSSFLSFGVGAVYSRERKRRAAGKDKGQKAPDSSRHDQRVHQKLIHMYAARTGQWRATLLFLPLLRGSLPKGDPSGKMNMQPA